MADDIHNFVLIFTSIVWEAFPFIVFGAVVSGLLEEFVPQRIILKIFPKKVLLSIVIAAHAGLLFPVCECGIVVILRRLISKGVPLASCLAYMLAGPIVNIIVIGSTWAAFAAHGIATQMVLLRVLLAILVAVTTSYIIHIIYGNRVNNCIKNIDVKEEARLGKGNQVSVVIDETSYLRYYILKTFVASRAILNDFIDIMVFLIIGALLAASVKLYIDIDRFNSIISYHPILSILLMMFVASLMSLCSEADAFVIASFVNISIPAKIAFLVYGPMIDIKLLVLYSSIFKYNAILVLVTSATTLVILMSYLVSIIM